MHQYETSTQIGNTFKNKHKCIPAVLICLQDGFANTASIFLKTLTYIRKLSFFVVPK